MTIGWPDEHGTEQLSGCPMSSRRSSSDALCQLIGLRHLSDFDLNGTHCQRLCCVLMWSVKNKNAHFLGAQECPTGFLT